MNENVNLTIFKGVSKKSGKEYFSVKLVVLVNGELITTSGLLYPNVADKLINKGFNYVDLTIKKESDLPY